MLAELGSFLLLLLMVIAGLQTLASARISSLPEAAASSAAVRLSCHMSYGLWGVATASLLLLFALFVCDDFSVLSVATHSHQHKPLLYKLSASWGHHEGSLLLWLWVLTSYGAFLAKTGRKLPAPIYHRALAVQAGIILCITGFVIFTSSPFARLWPAAVDGHGLNPLLQDVGLAIHPPMLYMGYVGYSLLFSLACAGLSVPGAMAQHYWRYMRACNLLAWAFLSLGIMLGAWWAHRELGWGGWWFWDPVENASLMPWLAGTALLHLLPVAEKRSLWRKGCLFFAMLTFILSLLGTFLVRSGLLTSVHAFASDPARGVVILLVIGLLGGYGLWQFARSTHPMQATIVRPPAPLSREHALLLNSLLFTLALLVVVLGVGYPMVTQAIWQNGVSIGPAYYHGLMLPLSAVAMLALLFLSETRWQRDALPRLLRSHARSLFLTGVLAAAISLDATSDLSQAQANWPGGWYVFPALWLALHQLALLRLKINRKQFPTYLAHACFALLCMGAAGTYFGQQQTEAILKPGESMTLGRYTITYQALQTGTEQDYTFARARLEVKHPQQDSTTLLPERRYYTVQGKDTAESERHWHGLTELHAVVADVNQEQHISLRFYLTPWIMAVWLGGSGLALLAALSAARRLAKLS